MKYWIVPLVCLAYSVILFGQQEVSSTGFSAGGKQSIKVSLNTIPDDERFLSSQISLSHGFVNSEFEDIIEVAEGADLCDIAISTLYSGALQYTVSDMEGLILRQGRFIGQKSIDLGRRKEGKYAVYIFAGTQVVKAFTVDIQRFSQGVF